jgi:large subunit ribosomal protein L22
MTTTKRSISKFMRVPPRKARLVAANIRGLSVEKAIVQLKFCKQKTGRLLLKTLMSAVANAETQLDVMRDELKVKEVRIDPGPVLKRMKAGGKGGRAPIFRRTSHFSVVVGK